MKCAHVDIVVFRETGQVMFCLTTSRNLRKPGRSLIALIRIGVTSCRFYRPSAISVNLSNRKMTHENLQQQQQSFDYFLVIDFEATCAKDYKPQPQVTCLSGVYSMGSKLSQAPCHGHTVTVTLSHSQCHTDSHTVTLTESQ